jgi:DNA-binding IclR family transcriptional regulator
MLNRTSDKSDGAGNVRVISRAADILRALKADGGGLSLGDIAEQSGLPRSTVQRLVNALTSEGLVMASASGGYRLGPEIQSLAVASRTSVADLIRPILTGLSRRTGETVDLAVFQTDHMLFVDQVVGTHRLRAVSAVGETFPMTVTANGKATLALLGADVVAQIVGRELPGLGRGAVRRLDDALARVRENGFALDLDEHTKGISAVGAAFGTGDGMIYAISIPVPSQRFIGQREALTEALLEAVATVRGMV